jgi:hypothetical protein
MRALLPRVLDPRLALLSQLAIAAGLASAGLTAAAVLAEPHALEALLLAALVGFAVGSTVFLLARNQRDVLEEACDLWDLKQVAVDGVRGSRTVLALGRSVERRHRRS